MAQRAKEVEIRIVIGIFAPLSIHGEEKNGFVPQNTAATTRARFAKNAFSSPGAADLRVIFAQTARLRFAKNAFSSLCCYPAAPQDFRTIN
jgi:hypothetical protein